MGAVDEEKVESANLSESSCIRKGISVEQAKTIQPGDVVRYNPRYASLDVKPTLRNLGLREGVEYTVREVMVFDREKGFSEKSQIAVFDVGLELCDKRDEPDGVIMRPVGSPSKAPSYFGTCYFDLVRTKT